MNLLAVEEMFVRSEEGVDIPCQRLVSSKTMTAYTSAPVIRRTLVPLSTKGDNSV